MKSKNYKYLLSFITLTVLATIGLQIFWNIKNYKENRIQLIREVQTAFDNSIEYYYVEDSKNDFLAIFTSDTTISNTEFIDKIIRDSVFKKNKLGSKSRSFAPSEKSKNPKKQNDVVTVALERIEYTEENGQNDQEEIKITPIPQKKQKTLDLKGTPTSPIRILKGKKATDSISKLEKLVNKVLVFAVKDSIEFTKLSAALNKELERKNIAVAYSLQHFKADTLFAQFRKGKNTALPLSAISGTTYLPKAQKLQISFSDPYLLVLKRSRSEIILSMLLSLCVIFCLLYLLKTIQKQKKIDEIKNDLISNITHEFKTPITTISTAIEGIKNFNSIDDKEKTMRYLDISTQQLKKLEIMVEKLLETASLQTNQLQLNKEEINSVELIKAHLEKHQMTTEKKLDFSSNQEIIMCHVDVFHFENAVSNLIDNAIKYGGAHISIAVIQTGKQVEISIEDNGIGIDKTQREKIFEQFYRIPKGNIHDVKGFGIGLFYAKKIIEKHGGTLLLKPNPTTTIFKITFPNV